MQLHMALRPSSGISVHTTYCAGSMLHTPCLSLLASFLCSFRRSICTTFVLLSLGNPGPVLIDTQWAIAHTTFWLPGVVFLTVTKPLHQILDLGLAASARLAITVLEDGFHLKLCHAIYEDGQRRRLSTPSRLVLLQ